MFGERLRQLRKSRGITQEQLAALIGVERSSIGKYEGKGKVIPSDDVKFKIAQLFGVSVDYLLGRTDVPVTISANDLNDAEREVIALYGELTEQGQGLVLDYMRMLLSKREFRKEEHVKSIM